MGTMFVTDPPKRIPCFAGVIRAAGRLVLLAASISWADTPAVIPLPQQMQLRPGLFTLCPAQPIPGAPAPAVVRILTDAASLENAQYLAGRFFRATGFQFQILASTAAGPVKNAILLTTTNALPGLGAEGYELTVAPDSVIVRAPGQSGIFYGIQTLLQLLPPQILAPRPVSGVAWTAPCVYIQDQPRFAWRGAMLDVSRHFFDKQEVERVLDAMALHKLNTFHWHLTDDHGWRIQILSYPLLTQTGAWRTNIDYYQNPAASTAYNAAGQYGGFYTQNDIREVVAYGRQRHITIVPEIELPAHSTAGLASYPQFGCGNAASAYDMDGISFGKGYGVSMWSLAGPGCWTFFTNVLTEVMGLFPGPYIHCGGDEVTATGDRQWTTYPPDNAQMQALGINPAGGRASIIAYQHWFSTNLAAFVSANGRTMVAWSEFEAGGIVPNAALMDWGTGSGSYAIPAAEAGQPVVMTPSPRCYVNYCQTANLSTEPRFIVGGSPAFLTVTNVYSFEPVPAALPSQFAQNILGAQCNLWTEYVPSPENVEFKLFPRLCAMAEATWTPAALKNYSDFTNRLVLQKERLDQMRINYNHEAVTQIGTWTQPIPTTGTNLTYDITAYVMKSGEIDVSFWLAPGSNALDISTVALFENGVQIDLDTFAGISGTSYTKPVPYYILHLRQFHPGATYTLSASVAGDTGTASNGTVYLTNWN
jgi:hexosaminidase